MASFTDEQIAEIERTNSVHVGVQSEQFGGFLRDGAVQVEEIRALLGTHSQELQDNADRVTRLVAQVNEKEAELAQLTQGIKDFATKQDAQTSSASRARPKRL